MSNRLEIENETIHDLVSRRRRAAGDPRPRRRRRQVRAGLRRLDHHVDRGMHCGRAFGLEVHAPVVSLLNPGREVRRQGI